MFLGYFALLNLHILLLILIRLDCLKGYNSMGDPSGGSVSGADEGDYWYNFWIGSKKDREGH